MIPQCKVFLCISRAFDYRKPGDPAPLYYCEEHAESLGLSAAGRSHDDGVPIKSIQQQASQVRQRLSSADPDLPKPLENPMKPVECVETGQTFKSAREAAESSGIPKGTLAAALAPSAKSPGKAGGKTWRYLDKNSSQIVRAPRTNKTTRLTPPPNGASPLAALAHVAAGSRTFRMTDVELVMGELTIRAKTIELSS